jgi:hypothetical protein
LVFFGMIPIGSLLAGIAAAELGVPATAALWAVLQLVVASLLWFRWPGLRRLP